MGIFGKKETKHEEAAKSFPSPDQPAATSKSQNDQGPAVKILGSGCAKCNSLEASAKTALVELGWDPAIEHVTDFAKIAAFGVMSTPALVIDGKVISTGKVLKPQEVAALFKKARG